MIKWILHPNYYITTAMQLLLPVFLFIGLGAEWYWWVVSFVFYFLYLCIGNNIGHHRFFCHRYFEMNKVTEWFVTWCATVSCLGSPLSYVIIHNIHHKHHDTDLDPHGIQRGWKSVLFYYHKHINPKEIVCTKNLSRLTKQYHVLHNYYTLFILLNVAIFALFGWKVLLFAWAIPASLTLWATSLVLLLQHDRLGPSNTRCYQWFAFGETYHKNHHDNASLIDHSLGDGIDWTYQITRLLAKNEPNPHQSQTS
jgi:fatty-acid desaturase